jgi:hypothetical protein
MKKSLMGLLAISLVLFAGGTASAVSVYLNPSTQTLVQGGTAVATVELVVCSVVSPGVDTLNLVLRFDPDLVDVTGVGNGAFMQIETFITFGPNLDNVVGEISYTQWNLGGGGATGSGTAMIFTFVADPLNSGTCDLDYTAWLLEPGTGKPITVTASTGDNIVVIPEPATLLLIAAGLAALGGYARRRKS